MADILEKSFGAEPRGWIYKEWRKIGNLKSGEAVYRNILTGRHGVEREFIHLTKPTKEEGEEIKLL